MTLVDIMEIEDELTSRGRAAIEAYVPRSDELSSVAPILVRKGRHLDVDGILARSLPGTFRQSSCAKPSEV